MKNPANNRLVFVLVSILMLTMTIACKCDSVENISRFKKADVLGESLLLGDVHLGPLCKDISNKDGFKSIYYRYEANPIFPFTNVIYNDDKSRIYLASDTSLFEFTDDFILLRQISVEAFCLPSKRGYFVRPLHISQHKLWLTVCFQEKEKKIQGDRSLIIQWDPSLSPNTRSLVNDTNGGWWAIDDKCNLYLPSMGIYSFNNKSLKEKGEWDFSYADVSEHNGVLLSSGYQTNHSDTVIKLLKDEKELSLCYGSYSQWGKDGAIYYLKKNNELWRCDPNGTKSEFLFSLESNCIIDPTSLVFSDCGRFLAFFYKTKETKDHNKGTIVLDFKTDQYLDDKGVGFGHYVWLKKVFFNDKKINVNEVYQYIAMHDAVFSWPLKELSELIRLTDNINSQDALGNTPLHYASEIGRYDAVVLLLANNADKTIKNHDGFTALELAKDGYHVKLWNSFFTPSYNSVIELLTK